MHCANQIRSIVEWIRYHKKTSKTLTCEQNPRKSDFLRSAVSNPLQRLRACNWLSCGSCAIKPNLTEPVSYAARYPRRAAFFIQNLCKTWSDCGGGWTSAASVRFLGDFLYHRKCRPAGAASINLRLADAGLGFLELLTYFAIHISSSSHRS